MNKNMKQYILSGLVALLIAIGVVTTMGGKTVVTNNPLTTTYGSVSTLDGVDNPYMTLAGKRVWMGSVGLVATSSTICSIKNPFNSTSTIVFAGLKVRSGILGANNISLSTSTNTYATSSTLLILDATIPSQNTATIQYAGGVAAATRILGSNTSTGQSQVILAPNEYLNWRLATTTGAGALAAYYGGTCSAEILDN